MKYFFNLLVLMTMAFPAKAQKIAYTTDGCSGAIQRIYITGDKRDMNWVLQSDGSQYPWADRSFGWGLGKIVVSRNGTDETCKWSAPVAAAISNGKNILTYRVKDIEITVERSMDGDDLIEKYSFKNISRQRTTLKDIAINTPFNDNYPDALTCVDGRVNAHIWAGGNSAYVCGINMGGRAPHVGLVVTEGSIDSYEVERQAAQQSNFRGLIQLNPASAVLNEGESTSVAWRIFSHTGWANFFDKAKRLGTIIGSSDKYVYEKGETAIVRFECGELPHEYHITVNGKPLKTNTSGNTVTARYKVSKPEELNFSFNYDGKHTKVVCLGISDANNLMSRRTKFIMTHQQMKDKDSKLFGAYMVYDNEGDSIFTNNWPNHGRSDCDPGRERLGMGVLLAMRYGQTKDKHLLSSLTDYARFVRSLQTPDYKTFSTPEHKSKHRGYNYPWVADFYFKMYQVTGNKQYATDGYQTMMAYYRYFKHSFYAIGIPTYGVEELRKAGMTAQADTLLNNYRRQADTFVANGYAYPRHEVNYEQSIVAPSIIHLLNVYFLTNEQKYLEAAKLQMPLLEAFSGLQPDYHLNEIAIRHWDDYWFGKRRFWGDTQVHYWSALTAVAYSLYAKAMGDKDYQQRANNILRNNLCQFFEDGKASCAFVYPSHVDGKQAYFFDPYANDQDWAMVYYKEYYHE